MKLPPRTYVSELADGELILLDVMFDAPVPRPMLEDEKFSIHNNTNYSHGFDTQQLDIVLNRLLDQGFLFAERQNYLGEKADYYGLTSTGGNIWASELKPNTTIFFMDS